MAVESVELNIIVGNSEGDPDNSDLVHLSVPGHDSRGDIDMVYYVYLM